jgi:hypothetical protein
LFFFYVYTLAGVLKQDVITFRGSEQTAEGQDLPIFPGYKDTCGKLADW